MKEIFAVSAALLALIGHIPYIVGIFRGQVRPHLYTWLIGSIVSLIVIGGQFVKGAGVGILPTLVTGVFTVSICALSLKYGYRSITRSDRFFLFAALACGIPWLMTDDPTLSIIMAVSIDVIAYAPTIRKTWREPSTESPVLYSANLVRHLLALLAMEQYNVATTLHSVAMIGTNLIMVGTLALRKDRDRATK